MQSTSAIEIMNTIPRTTPLFRAQRYHRIDAAGAEGGEPAGEESDDAEKGGDADESRGINGADAVKNAAEQAGPEKREGKADDGTN